MTAKWLLALVLSLGLLVLCRVAVAQPALPPPWRSTIAPPPERDLPHDTHPSDPVPSGSWDPEQTLTAAAANASPGPRRVLETARAMIDDSTIVRGSCFDWVDAVYHRAGGHSHDTFHGSHTGPYADASELQPGDWTFFINHEWGDDTHSAIFIGWVDQRARVAMMVSYAGGHREEPGRFGEYELTSVFRVVRMTDDPPPPARSPARTRPAPTHHRRTHGTAPERRDPAAPDHDAGIRRASDRALRLRGLRRRPMVAHARSPRRDATHRAARVDR